MEGKEIEKVSNCILILWSFCLQSFWPLFITYIILALPTNIVPTRCRRHWQFELRISFRRRERYLLTRCKAGSFQHNVHIFILLTRPKLLGMIDQGPHPIKKNCSLNLGCDCFKSSDWLLMYFKPIKMLKTSKKSVWGLYGPWEPI